MVSDMFVEGGGGGGGGALGVLGYHSFPVSTPPSVVPSSCLFSVANYYAIL